MLSRKRLTAVVSSQSKIIEEKKMKKRKIVFLAGFLILMVSVCAFSQGTKVTWYSFNMGFANSTGSNTMLKSAVGQSFVGSSKKTGMEVLSGFLADTLFRSRLVGVNDKNALPVVYELYQNYPNPFNPTTIIKYDLPNSQHVGLKIFNILGQEVATLIDEVQEAGYKSVDWSANNVSSGIYFYKLTAGDFVEIKKMLLVR